VATVSIIVPVYNHHALTRACLEAVFDAEADRSAVEVIVVDDGSAPPAAGNLGPIERRVRIVRHEQNAGFARTCNDGAAAASGELLVFLNNDTVPRAGWLSELVAYAEAQPQAAVVASKLLFPNETIQHAGVVICQDRYPRHLYTGFPSDHPAVNKPRRFQVVTAACALVRRAAFEAAGGFDTEFANGYEDVDLCLRLGELGYEVHYCPTSVVVHHEAITRGDVPDTLEHNDRLYHERWAQRVRPDDVGYYLEDGLLAFQFGPGESYPAHLAVSPLLAVLDTERQQATERLLNERARQVFDLVKTNIRLSTLLIEAGQRADLDPPLSPEP